MSSGQLNIKNKKGYFEYEILDKYVAGIQLQGSEIKSIREGKASIVEAYCYFRDRELYVKGMRIEEYGPASYNNHNPTRERKLLLNRQELDKLSKKLRDKGLTVIPLKMFLSGSGYAKLEIGLAKGKKLHDKRNTIKDRDDKRTMDRAMKNRG